MRKIIIAAALTAALTLTAVPAFANPTTLTVKTEAPAAVDVTVPIVLPVTANALGGGLTATPNNYQLINKSVYKIKVSSMVATETAEWKLATTPIAGDALPSAGATVGDIELKLTPTAAGSTPWQVSTTAPTTDLGWLISPRTLRQNGTTYDPVPTPFPITIAGSSSAVKKMSDPNVEAIKITFTVEPVSSP